MKQNIVTNARNCTSSVLINNLTSNRNNIADETASIPIISKISVIVSSKSIKIIRILMFDAMNTQKYVKNSLLLSIIILFMFFFFIKNFRGKNYEQ